MEVIAIINQKGGVGKTTTAHNFGIGLALKGYKVLFLDLDQGSNLSYALDVLELGESTGSDTSQLFTGAKIKNLIITTNKGWDAIPGSGTLATLEVDKEDERRAHKVYDALQEVKSKYDYVIMDTPPGLGIITINALTAADKIIIPALAAVFSLQGVGQLSRTLDAIRETTNPSLAVEGILLTLYKGRSTLTREVTAMMEQTASLLHTKVFNSRIREYMKHQEAQAYQESTLEYAPKTAAAADYMALVEEFLEGTK